MRHKAFLVAIVGGLMATVSAGAAEGVSDYERFQLDNGCFPLQLKGKPPR